MAVTISQTRLDYGVVKVEASSSLGADATLYWYVDGKLVQAASFPRERIFSLQPGHSALIEVLDTTAAATEAYPGEVLLQWYAVDGAVQYYVQQWVGVGAADGDLPVDDEDWSTLRTVVATDEEVYNHLTEWLDDQTEYTFRVAPVNEENIQGSSLMMTFTVVCRPDAPDTTCTYDADTQRVTVAAA